MKFRYSEIFGNTIQGEGHYTGIPTVWVRFWGCNFNCNGFGQKNPLDPSTWNLPYQDINASDFTNINELPVFKQGCDSSYSWSKKFEHLSKQSTAAEIANELEILLKNDFNPNGLFKHPKSNQWTHLALTGGEPMMNQTAIIELYKEFARRDNKPGYMTIETNGTQKLREKFIKELFNEVSDIRLVTSGKILSKPTELFWSVSPKLSTSGESWKNAIKPDVVKEYSELSPHGQLKFVVNGSERCWDEVEEATNIYRKHGINFPVWIMPVGATEESQRQIQAEVCEEACRRGYNTAARVHAWIFDNAIGK